MYFENKIRPLHLAIGLLVALGVVDTIFLIAAIINHRSFSGGGLLYVVVAWGLYKRYTKTYTVTAILVSLGLALLIGAIIAVSINAIQFGLTPEFDLDIVDNLPDIFIALLYVAGIPLVVACLFNPETRKEFDLPVLGLSPRTLYLTPFRFVALSLTGALLAAALIGPYLLLNPYQRVAHALATDATIADKLDSIRKTTLTKMRIQNYYFSASLNVEGDKNTGFYYADLSPDGTVTLTNYGYIHNQDALSDIPLASASPIVAERQLSPEGNAVILISTSFETNAGNKHEVLPFIQSGREAWGSTEHAHSGAVAVNAIPNGNPGDLRYFNTVSNVALLSSRLTGTYAPFAIEQFKQIELNFWRLSTSNPSKTHNCLGSLVVEYRIDAGQWQSKMAYCGRHKSLPHEWRESKLTFDTAGHKELEIRFRYEYPPLARKDATAVYLVDDLKVIGYRK